MAVVARKPPSLPLLSLFLSSPLSPLARPPRRRLRLVPVVRSHTDCVLTAWHPLLALASLPPLKAATEEGRKWNGKDKFGLRCLISRQLAAGEGGGRTGAGGAGVKAFGDYAGAPPALVLLFSLPRL